MAGLTNECCTPDTRGICCEPEDKPECCGPQHGAGCGCAETAASTSEREQESATATNELEQVRGSVRARYARAAQSVSAGHDAGCGCGPNAGLTDEHGTQVFGARLYDQQVHDSGTAAAIGASLGCGVPTAVADLQKGETVLDLGSGAGGDVLISARRVGRTGKAIGLDMTDEMLALARANAAEAGVTNVEFLKGYLEAVPLPDASVDVVISNCVINLSGDKPKTIAEAARVLRPAGRFAISDVIAAPDMDETTKADMAAWTGCIAGALTEDEFRTTLAEAGLEDVEIKLTHQVHHHASAAIIRARKPAGPNHQKSPTGGMPARARAISAL